jgi:prepilin-type processing-associated H-X9-DG protein
MRIETRLEAFGELIAAAGDGRHWALAYGDRVTLWDGTSQAAELPPADEQVLDLRYDGQILLAAPMRARGGAWERLPPLFRTLDPWRAVAATWADSDRLLVAATAPSGGHEQEVRLYDGRTRAAGNVLWADDAWQRVEAVAAGAGRLAAAALEVRVWDAVSLEQLVTIADRGKQVRRLTLVDGRVIVGYADGHVAVDGRTGWKAHEDEARALAVDPRGQRLVTGGWDGCVALWTLGGELLAEADLGVEVADVAFLGDDRLLALHQLPETGVTLVSLGALSQR